MRMLPMIIADFCLEWEAVFGKTQQKVKLQAEPLLNWLWRV